MFNTMITAQTTDFEFKFQKDMNISNNNEQNDSIPMRKPKLASKVFQAGEEVLKEFPLLYINKNQESNPTAVEAEKITGIHRRVWTVYFHYMKLSDETKSQIREMYFIESSKKCESFRNLLIRSDYKNEIDVEEFLSVTMIFNYNAIEEHIEGSDNTRDGTAIYATASCFTHSCSPNCYWSSNGDGWCTMRAIKPIAIGEVLTFNHYDADFVAQPTALRRAYLERSKEIACQCERCICPGDDTRQFSCVNPECSGRYFVNQPSPSSRALMLPCTVCGESANQEHQKLMLYREKTMAATVKNILEEIRIFPAKLKGGVATPTAQEILQFQALSPNHYLTHYLAKIQQVSHEAVGDKMRAAQKSAESAYALESFLPFPSHLLCKAYLNAGEAHEELDTTAALLQAKTYFQKALQLARALYGDMECRQTYHVPLTRVLGKRDARTMSDDVVSADGTVKIKQCTFCGNRPTAGPIGTATSLRRCAGCKQVAYCSVLCQKSHWVLHQPTCVKPAPIVPAAPRAVDTGVIDK